MAAREGIRVEVVYATPERQELVAVDLPPGADVAAAIKASGMAGLFPGEPVDAATAGVWGRPVERDHVLADGDRIELYRPLVKDPREARRELAAAGRNMGARLKDPD